MSDEETTPEPEESEEPRDSMEDVLAEALAEEGAGDGVPSIDEVDIRDALRAAMKPLPEKIDITREVQKKIREESDGQFFADGWSTAKSPKETYLVTSIVMLVVVIVIYVLIRPY